MNNAVYEFIHSSLSYEDDEIDIVDTQLFYTIEDAKEYFELKNSIVYDEYIEHIKAVYENDELDIRDLMSDPEYSEYKREVDISLEDICKIRFCCNYSDYGSDELIIYKKSIMKFA